ncbi:MAG: sulfatase-like hydrolase/transferase, partial [Bacteroidales bacterium]
GFRNNGDNFDGSQQTFPKLLKEAGYETAVVGKWHLRSKPEGFSFWRVLPGQGMYYNPDFIEGDDTTRYEGYVTDLITDFAIDWLESGRDKDKPFMMLYQHKAPHRDWLPPQEYLGLFHDLAFPEPATLFDDHSGMGTAAREAEMLISEHMGLSIDNKVDPVVLDSLGLKSFFDWYDESYYANLAPMSQAERSRWDSVYGEVSRDFAARNPTGDELLHHGNTLEVHAGLPCLHQVGG